MRGEGQNVEYKQTWRDEYLKWVCGFANADGGRMFIGMLDDKFGNKVVGVADWKKLLEDIPNQMRDTMGMIADVKRKVIEGKNVVEIVVPPYPVPISLRGVYYIRRGATNQRLSGPGLESFLMKRRGLHWENLPCPRLKMKDISAHEIKRFKDLAIEKGRLDASVRRETKEMFVHIEKVKDECKRHGCPEPHYEVNAGDPGDLLVRLDAAPDTTEKTTEKTENTTEKTVGTTEKTITKTITKTNTKSASAEVSVVTREEWAILQIMREKPTISAEEIGIRMGLTRAGVIYHINKLKTITKLRRVGTARRGCWEVL